MMGGPLDVLESGQGSLGQKRLKSSKLIKCVIGITFPPPSPVCS